VLNILSIWSILVSSLEEAEAVVAVKGRQEIKIREVETERDVDLGVIQGVEGEREIEEGKVAAAVAAVKDSQLVPVVKEAAAEVIVVPAVVEVLLVLVDKAVLMVQRTVPTVVVLVILVEMLMVALAVIQVDLLLFQEVEV
tara:strand:+ start:164 stop:586 length:423 start_codon:yes stop_codon:yes gene_type:complete